LPSIGETDGTGFALYVTKSLTCSVPGALMLAIIASSSNATMHFPSLQSEQSLVMSSGFEGSNFCSG